MDDMDEDYDGPQDMEETVAQISALYNEVIPPLQNALAVIQGATSNTGSSSSTNGGGSVLLRLLTLFRMQLNATNVLVFVDKEGQEHTGLDAVYAAYLEFSERVMTLETALTFLTTTCPCQGT